jgi:hypothetical protein
MACSSLLEYFIRITYYCCICFCCCCCNYKFCTVYNSYTSLTTLSPHLSVTLFTLLFLNKQTRHGRNTVSFYFFLFISGHAKCLSREQCVGSSARVTALCSNCCLQKYLKWWPAALCKAKQSVSVNVNEGTQDPENCTQYRSYVKTLFTVYA